MLYSDKVMDHFNNPRNVGVIEDADGVGEVGNPVCGDIMKITFKVDETEHLDDVKFQTLGCGAAIATSSIVTEMAKGMTLEEAAAISQAAGRRRARRTAAGQDALQRARHRRPEGRRRRLPGQARSRADLRRDQVRGPQLRPARRRGPSRRRGRVAGRCRRASRRRASEAELAWRASSSR